MDYSQVDQFIETHLPESIQDIKKLVAQPGVSAFNTGLHECAAVVAEMLERRGFTTSIEQTGGAPIVFAERKGRSNKTLLFYNHYDVQPAEPFDLWNTPPFEATLIDGVLYGRGVSDDKGHFTSRLFAIDALLAADGELPCNIKFIVEGEEETSSERLLEYVRSHTDTLAADACIWEYGGVDAEDRPVEYLGLRGILYVELSVETANQDIHSGLGGTIFPNSAWRLVWALNSLKGSDENVRIAGFYNKVKPVSYKTLSLLHKLPDTAEDYHQRFAIKDFLRDLKGGAELRKAEAHEPSCTICGLNSGYQGIGAKTIIPAKASAKVDFRLVPDQDPVEIIELLRAHLDRNGFDDIHITNLGGDRAAVTDPDDPFVQLVVRSAEEIYGQPMLILPSVGGSGPNSIVMEYLKLPIVTTGAAHPGAQAHSPNENLRLDLYIKTTRHVTRILKAFSGEDTLFS